MNFKKTLCMLSFLLVALLFMSSVAANENVDVNNNVADDSSVLMLPATEQ